MSMTLEANLPPQERSHNPFLICQEPKPRCGIGFDEQIALTHVSGAHRQRFVLNDNRGLPSFGPPGNVKW